GPGSAAARASSSSGPSPAWSRWSGPTCRVSSGKRRRQGSSSTSPSSSPPRRSRTSSRSSATTRSSSASTAENWRLGGAGGTLGGDGRAALRFQDLRPVEELVGRGRAAARQVPRHLSLALAGLLDAYDGLHRRHLA